MAIKKKNAGIWGSVSLHSITVRKQTLMTFQALMKIISVYPLKFCIKKVENLPRIVTD